MRHRDGLWALAGTLALVAALLSGCSSSSDTKASSNKKEAGAAGTAPARIAGWSETYRRALRPSLLFLGVEQLALHENRLIGNCMRARGWSRYPVPSGRNGWLPLGMAQTVDSRRRLAAGYGERLLTQPAAEAGLEPYRRFGDWLQEQPDSLRHEYLDDFSGDRGDEEEPKMGSCKWLVNRRLRPLAPALVPALEAEAGKRYDEYVTGTTAYHRAEGAWRSCMRRRGYPRAGEPLAVWRPRVAHVLVHRAALSRRLRVRLARSLSDQATAEHECSAEHLDDVVQRGDRRVLRALIARFPEYRRLVER